MEKRSLSNASTAWAAILLGKTADQADLPDVAASVAKSMTKG